MINLYWTRVEINNDSAGWEEDPVMRRETYRIGWISKRMIVCDVLQFNRNKLRTHAHIHLNKFGIIPFIGSFGSWKPRGDYYRKCGLDDDLFGRALLVNVKTQPYAQMLGISLTSVHSYLSEKFQSHILTSRLKISKIPIKTTEVKAAL